MHDPAEIFHTPFSVYTDPTNRVYHALGMTLRSMSPGPDSKRGNYVRHGMLRGIGMVVVNALKVRMPLFEDGGDISQLGGEFVLGPGYVFSVFGLEVSFVVDNVFPLDWYAHTRTGCQVRVRTHRSRGRWRLPV
jgi:AhpC/TSA antioxidant enzyme